MPRLVHEYRALVDWLTELGITEQLEGFFFLDMGVERGGILLNELESDPLAAAIYEAGCDALRLLAAQFPAKEFFVAAQRRALPVGVLMAPEDVIEDEHFIARGFPVEIRHDDLNRSFVYPGAPYRASASPWRVQGRAPHVGEHTQVVLEVPDAGS
jgi:hypothetical protein